MTRKDLLSERRERIIQLSMPKVSKAVWATLGPPVVWGNQELMRPISKAALKCQTSNHLLSLAVPKKNFQTDHPEKCCRDYFAYSCGRSSVIWQVQPSAMKANASKRIEELSRPKSVPSGYEEDRLSYVLGCGRSSPIWTVNKSALGSNAPERVNELARPKSLHRSYKPSREVAWLISDAAKNAKTPPSIESLSRPKERLDLPSRDPEWVIKKSTLSAHTTARVEDLSKPKKLIDRYIPNRDVEWKVSHAALNAKPTERVKGLAVPLLRDDMDHVQFDPLAFKVKTSALKGKIPSRIYDLARPVDRGGN
ncbi:sperm microtubule associated protein 2-like isoform X2 [Hydra vulgaris]|uniref:Sperm microtubule associated protein 2-like isoform X2 n=1 Tax=Hydra vulgaris TaxID=6087 RepID=A0ABM4BIJ7_HYDVU